MYDVFFSEIRPNSNNNDQFQSSSHFKTGDFHILNIRIKYVVYAFKICWVATCNIFGHFIIKVHADTASNDCACQKDYGLVLSCMRKKKNGNTSFT